MPSRCAHAGEKRIASVRSRAAMVLALLALFASPGCGSSPSPVLTPPRSAWSALASGDVEAIHEGVRDLHPAMRDVGAQAFADRLERAYRTARASAAGARSYLDWRESVTQFVIAFRDGHTFLRLDAIPSRARWPGFLVEGRDGGYVVAAVRPDSGVQPGDRLTACDGVPLDRLLEARLDGREADWSKAPERIRQAWRLLVDYRVDGPPPLTSCEVTRSGARVAVALRWRIEAWSDLAPSTSRLQRIPAQPPPDRLVFLPDGAALVTLGSFGDEGALNALEQAMRDARTRLHASPYVVFDLRGNRGGDSTWGERLAEILWGEEAVAARARPGLGKLFRASPQAVAQLRSTAERFAAQGKDMAPVADYWRRLAERTAASAHGDERLFVDAEPEPPSAVAVVRPSDYDRPAFVLTDAGCFSSCVVVADTLRRLGAVQVGEPTGQNEEYGEAAGPLTLPSGLARWWVPLAIIRQPREALGGLPVDVAWPGSMDDDDAILRWIASLASARRAAEK